MSMSTIKNFNEYKKHNTTTSNNIKPVNEFFGGLLKKLIKNAKNNLSMKVSKRIGGAGEADKAISDYKEKMEGLIEQELAFDKKMIEYKIGMEETGGDEKELDAIRKEVDDGKGKVEKMKDAAKGVFDVNIKNIISDEEDKKIKGYINLKRAELAEELLALQLGQMKEMGGNNLEGDDEFEELVKSLEDKASKSNEVAEKMYKTLSDKLDKGDDEENGDVDVEYKEGDKVTYTRKNGDENEAEVIEQGDTKKGWIRLKTDKISNGFNVQLGKVVGIVGAEEEKEEADETDNTEDLEDIE